MSYCGDKKIVSRQCHQGAQHQLSGNTSFPPTKITHTLTKMLSAPQDVHDELLEHPHSCNVCATVHLAQYNASLLTVST